MNTNLRPTRAWASGPFVEPWCLQLDGVVKTAVQGRVAKPTVRLRMRFDDFADLISRRVEPAGLVGGGRMARWATRAC